MKAIPIFLLLVATIGISCKEHGPPKNYRNSLIHSYSLIKVCTDILMLTNKELNTANYVVNLSNYETLGLEKTGVDSFIIQKNKFLPTSHEDSVIMGGVDEMHVKRSMLINFRSIVQKEKGVVIAEVQKYRSDKRQVTMELTLICTEDGYEFISGRSVDTH